MKNKDDIKYPGSVSSGSSKNLGLKDLGDNLSQVSEYLESVATKLAKLPKLTGKDKLQQEKLVKSFEEFLEGFKERQKEVTDFVEKVPGAPMRDFADKQSKEAYEKSPIGRLENFTKQQLKKITEMLEKPIDSVKNNEILKAVGNIIKTACNTIIKIVRNTLDNAIAMGELAKSVVTLGGAISKVTTSNKSASMTLV